LTGTYSCSAPCIPIFIIVLIAKRFPQLTILIRIRKLPQEVWIKATVINHRGKSSRMNLKEKAFKL